MTTTEIINAIADMSVLEVSELVKAMEEKFGVSAAAPAAAAAAPPASEAASADAEDEQSEFDVVLTGFGEGKKISVIKEVRSITGIGLKEAKEMVEASNSVVKGGVAKEEAASIKEKLTAAGAAVEVK